MYQSSIQYVGVSDSILRKFQTACGIGSDGILGPITAGKVFDKMTATEKADYADSMAAQQVVDPSMKNDVKATYETKSPADRLAIIDSVITRVANAYNDYHPYNPPPDTNHDTPLPKPDEGIKQDSTVKILLWVGGVLAALGLIGAIASMRRR